MMKLNNFPTDKYIRCYYEKAERLNQWYRGELPGFVPVCVCSPNDLAGWSCRSKETSLEAQANAIKIALKYQTDDLPFLEPWHGVGIYAAAFGCKYCWIEGNAPQTTPIIKDVEDLKNLNEPDIAKVQEMQVVLEMIRHFRNCLGKDVPISLTDTQSPNDTGSLIMETNEFFVACHDNQPVFEDFLGRITDLIVEFSLLQKELIGASCVTPGHLMISGSDIPGISISDDNVVFLSPAVYSKSAKVYNELLGEKLGGVAIHSCGNFVQNYRSLKETKGLVMIDMAGGPGSHDPNPNDFDEIREAFRESSIAVRIRITESGIDELDKLYDSGLKFAIVISGSEDIDASRKLYDRIKRKLDASE